ncbi:MAG: hypothetical protein ACD_73C00610G0003, partial [uncultured bacterium]
MSSLYIHFPFCLYKCHYCDFNSYATDKNEIPYQDYLNSLLKELLLRRKLFETKGFGFLNPKTSLKTIFFGGGTPSLMPAAHIEKILQEVAKYFSLDADCEITLEANPGTLTQTSINDFIKAGINRISIGVQSLDGAYLARFGRIHSVADAKNVLGWLTQSKLKSWNADLISGFPGETFSEWQKTLAEMLEFEPPHVSCYSFTVEEESPYGRWAKVGKVDLPDDEVQSTMLQWTRETLKASGYSPYEISNFAKQGHECRHNLAYWKYQDYLGLGAGAVSLFAQNLISRDDESFVVRTNNIKNPNAYMKALLDEESFFEKEIISKKIAQGEFMMMNLRLLNGFSENDFTNYFGESMSGEYQRVIADFKKSKL